MRFSVPQFIDVEDKIVGPLTLKQAIYIVGSLGAAFVLWRIFGFFIAVLIGGPVLFVAFLLAFVKVNNRPFVSIIYAAFTYVTTKKLYLWRKTPTKHVQTQPLEKIERRTLPVTPKVTQSKLRELAWSLDSDEYTK